MWVVLYTTLYDKVCQWLRQVGGFLLGTMVSYTKKTDSHKITEILLKVALNTITLTTSFSVTTHYGLFISGLHNDLVVSHKWNLYLILLCGQTRHPCLFCNITLIGLPTSNIKISSKLILFFYSWCGICFGYQQ